MLVHNYFFPIMAQGKTRLSTATLLPTCPTYLLLLQKASDVFCEELLLKYSVNVTGQYKQTVKTSLRTECGIHRAFKQNRFAKYMVVFSFFLPLRRVVTTSEIVNCLHLAGECTSCMHKMCYNRPHTLKCTEIKQHRLSS